MTSTPNLLRIGPILDDAFEVRADSGQCFQLSRLRADDDSWLVAKLENLPRIDRNLAELRGDD